MKDKESYNVPAYHFGILKLHEIINKFLEKNRDDDGTLSAIIRQAIEQQNVKIIPFEDLDGLTVGEVQTLLQNDGPLVMACYIKWHIIEKDYKTESYHIVQSFVLGQEDVDANLEISIDQAMEKALENIYETTPESVKKVIRCFFEKYQDKSHQDTVERIKKITDKK